MDFSTPFTSKKVKEVCCLFHPAHFQKRAVTDIWVSFGGLWGGQKDNTYGSDFDVSLNQSHCLMSVHCSDEGQEWRRWACVLQPLLSRITFPSKSNVFPPAFICGNCLPVGLIGCQSICWKKLHQMHPTLQCSGTRMSSSQGSYDGTLIPNFFTFKMLSLSVWREKLQKTYFPLPPSRVTILPEFLVLCKHSMTFGLGSTARIFHKLTNKH